MEKMRYLISDAANIVNVESHVLRYWEDELELDVPRNELGHRYYTKENIQEFQRIKELKEQGYQLKAIRMIVHNGPIDEFPTESGATSPAAATKPVVSTKLPVTAKTVASVKPAPDSPIPAEAPPVTAAVDKVPEYKTPVESSSGADMLPAVEQPLRAVRYPKEVRETQQSILDNTDKMAQFTDLMTQIVGKALAANNQELSQNISDEVGKQVIKEMNYLMREREELEEERFRKLDAAIRGSIRNKEEKKGFFKKKKPSHP